MCVHCPLSTTVPGVHLSRSKLKLVEELYSDVYLMPLVPLDVNLFHAIEDIDLTD